MAGNKEYIERLQMVVRQLYKCGSRHAESVYVREVFKGQTAWHGEVEVFDLFGHPKAKRCYGWSYGEPEHFIAILELPPVDSPQNAVRVGIIFQIEKRLEMQHYAGSAKPGH